MIVKHKGTGTCYLVRGANLYPWSFAGYGHAQAMSTVGGPFVILTPASTVKALQHGYRVQIHRSAT